MITKYQYFQSENISRLTTLNLYQIGLLLHVADFGIVLQNSVAEQYSYEVLCYPRG